ncbi:MAG: CocE/NonD family hydrolase [Cyanobacteria bacterium P01_D01_bin.105]
MTLSFNACHLQTGSVQTRDGVRLDADVYMPNANAVGEGPWPVLLMRQPYGRAIASTVVYAHPSWYAAQGYIVVIQDVRGRGTSEGKFELFAHEVADGEDTVRWAAQLPGSNGQVGMYGFSYQGMTQLHAAEGCAGSSSSALKAIAPAMTGYHLYEDWAYENGALLFQLGLTWAVQLAAETARIEGNVATYQKLVSAARQLPLCDINPARPNILSDVDSFFHQWIENPKQGDYWQHLTPQLSNVDLPMLHIGGWFDPYLRGDLRLHAEMTKRSQHSQPLCIGPWAHIPWNRKVGDVDFGPAAVSPIDRLQVQWFNHILKGEAWTETQIQLFEMGHNRWCEFERWPPAVEKTYFLHSDGCANIREDSGLLAEKVAESLCTDAWVHDPWNPSPSLGGHSAIPAGSFERTAVDSRGDVVTYTSAPLTQAMQVIGVVEVRCKITASAPSYDLCAVLSRVSEGKTYNLTQGYCRIDLETIEDLEKIDVESDIITLPLHPTCFRLEVGECFRLSLSAACFPAYLVNTGTGEQPAQAQLINREVVTLAIAIGGPNGARVTVPILKSQPHG